MKMQVVLTTAILFIALFTFQSSGGLALAAGTNLNGETLYDYGESRDPGRVDVLVAALDHPDRHIRRIAARALGKIGDDRCVMPLIEVLTSPREDPLVRSVAAWALGSMHAGMAVQPLYCCLNNHDRKVRHQASNALRKIAMHYVRLADAN